MAFSKGQKIPANKSPCIYNTVSLKAETFGKSKTSKLHIAQHCGVRQEFDQQQAIRFPNLWRVPQYKLVSNSVIIYTLGKTFCSIAFHRCFSDTERP